MAAASAGVASVLLMPSLMFLRTGTGSVFRKFLGLMYLILLLSGVFRTGAAIHDDSISIFSITSFQSMTFLTLTVVLLVGGVGIMLVSREEADREIEKLAITDGLTGLFNRRHFEGILNNAFAYYKRYKMDFAIMFIDIDDFKKVNDTFATFSETGSLKKWRILSEPEQESSIFLQVLAERSLWPCFPTLRFRMHFR